MKARRYTPPGAYLAAHPDPLCTLAFAEIAALIGVARLPEAAHRKGRWWDNYPRFPRALDGWLGAGWRVRSADFAGETVTFARGAG